MKQRLDQAMVERGIVASRSQATSYIRLGRVMVGGRAVTKPGYFVDSETAVELTGGEQYVSRAGLKLASVAKLLELDFKDKIVLDVGSSTGGFTDFALRRGAKKVIAVDVGTDQLHPSLRSDSRIELHEKTDIRYVSTKTFSPNRPTNFSAKNSFSKIQNQISTNSSNLDFNQKESFVKSEGSLAEKILVEIPDIILIDVSFISLREILPHIAAEIATSKTQIVAMVKPQFETGGRVKNAGVVKNNTERRQILRDFELWSRANFVIKAKADSEVHGAHGNQERFYLLKRLG